VSSCRAASTLLCALGLAVGGCGGSSSSSSSVPSPTSTETTTTATSAATSTPKPRRTTSTPASTHTASTSTSIATSTTSSLAPVAAVAPDGLRAGGSYSSYDNCSGACSGSVPASIERPLHLSAGGCAVSGTHTIAGTDVLGSGPVGPAQSASQSFTSFINSPWSGVRVTWFASSAYRGPILIRGREVGGPHAVGFGLGNVPYDQLQLNDSAGPTTGGTRQWPTFSRVRGAGCYAYQVDGTSFSDVIVFRAG
jgi:hypothetical protein